MYYKSKFRWLKLGRKFSARKLFGGERNLHFTDFTSYKNGTNFMSNSGPLKFEDTFKSIKPYPQMLIDNYNQPNFEVHKVELREDNAWSLLGAIKNLDKNVWRYKSSHQLVWFKFYNDKKVSHFQMNGCN